MIFYYLISDVKILIYAKDSKDGLGQSVSLLTVKTYIEISNKIFKKVELPTYVELFLQNF